jgi:hypothetical protein
MPTCKVVPTKTICPDATSQTCEVDEPMEVRITMASTRAMTTQNTTAEHTRPSLTTGRTTAPEVVGEILEGYSLHRGGAADATTRAEWMGSPQGWSRDH